MNGHEFTPVDGVLILTHADGVQRVCIDPENREQVERLARYLPDEWNLFEFDEDEHSIGAMQAALRSLIAPPKPEEPTGLGAVVEDAAEELWIRVNPRASAPWIQKNAGARGIAGPYRSWRDIDAANVLSEGVPE